LFFTGVSGGSRRDSRSGGGGGQIIILAVGIVLMILAPIAAQLLYFAISRKREYLADASSALYTRYPEGLASALEKLATSTQQLKAANQATAPMYTVNPFRQKGKAASDLTSTHPPISERIRILRAMAGAAPADYEAAYEKVKNGQHVVPASAIAAAQPVAIRAASAEIAPQPDDIDRARETSNALWRVGNYRTVDCECGARIRVPPSVNSPTIRCPRCGRILPLN
jgi:heat shock protein HtpX